jgi:hypothetical protein
MEREMRELKERGGGIMFDGYWSCRKLPPECADNLEIFRNCTHESICVCCHSIA